jgi:hypothetical protein
MKKPLVQVSSEKDGRAMLGSLCRRIIREIDTGYTPPFLSIVYPAMDGSLESMSSFVSQDVRVAKLFSEVLQETKDEFEKQFLLDMLGLDGEALPDAMKNYKKDMEAARERAVDRLKKEPEITDMANAEEMLKKLMAKDADYDS